jgi:hypothetical protein
MEREDNVGPREGQRACTQAPTEDAASSSADQWHQLTLRSHPVTLRLSDADPIAMAVQDTFHAASSAQVERVSCP